MKTKSIYFLAILIISLFIHNSVSQTLFTEDFNYPVMPSITGMNGWMNGYAPNPNNPIPVITPGLTFSGYSGSGIGNCILVRNDSAPSLCVRKYFTEASTGNVYMTCMLRVDSLTATANEDFVISLDKGGNLSDYRNELYIKKYNSSSFFLGIRKYQTTTYAPSLLNKNQTYLVVTKYKFVSGSATNDTVSLFIIPGSIPVSEPLPDQVTSVGNDAENLGEIIVNNHAYPSVGNGLRKSSVKIDGLKVSMSWGEAVLSAIEQTSEEIPETFKLEQNYPNPFNPQTIINFSIKQKSMVKLAIYDITGKEIAILVNNELTAGTYNYNFDAAKLSSGIYLYRIEAGDYVSTKKMTLIK